MTEILIDVSQFRKEGTKKVDGLSEFLKGKLGVDIKARGDVIAIGDDVSSKEYLRVLVRKFLHRSGLKERFRLISHEGKMVIKRRKMRGE